MRKITHADLLGLLMNIADLLAPDAVLPALKALVQEAAVAGTRASRSHALTHLSERRIFETLVERERLGTTGASAPVLPFPHGRMGEAKTITGIFARLENSVDYEAVDSHAGGLWCSCCWPRKNAGADHLKGLGARLAPAARQADLRNAALGAEPPKRFMPF